jgi:4-hydroxy-tetrahydrodipicolinate synthase
LFKAIFSTTNPIPIKAALRLQGWQVGSTRLPLGDMPQELNQKLEAVMKELSLLA